MMEAQSAPTLPETMLASLHLPPAAAVDQSAAPCDGGLERSADYLRTIAAELNDVGTEVHATLPTAASSFADAFKKGGRRVDDDEDNDARGFDTAMGLYKEAAATMMEAVDASASAAACGGDPMGTRAPPPSAEARIRSKARMEMIVAAKEMLLDREGREGKAASTAAAAPLRDAMLFGPESACDSGPIRLSDPIASSSVPQGGNAGDDRVGSATLCNIGLLQLRRAGIEGGRGGGGGDDPSLLDSALRFFRMSLQASEEGPASAARACVGGVDRITSLNNLGYGLYRKGMMLEAVEFFKDAVEEIDAAAMAEAQARAMAAAASRKPSSYGNKGKMAPLKSCLKVGRSDCDALAMGEDMLSSLEAEDEAAGIHSSAQPPASMAGSTGTSASSSWCQRARIVLLLNASRSLYASGEIESAFDVSAEALELCLQAEDQGRAQDDGNRDSDGSCKDKAEIASISVALLYNLGLLYELQGLHDRALQCYRQFVDKAPAESTSEIVVALTRVLLLEHPVSGAGQEAGVGDVSKVLSHLQDARTDLGHDHPNLSPVLRCVGSALSDREKFKYALPFLLESLRIKKAAEEQAGADTIVALNALGECYHGLGRLDDARKCYEEVRTIRSERLGAVLKEARAAARLAASSEDAPPPACTVSSVRFIFAVTLYNGGRIHFELGKREEAARYFDDALGLSETIVRSASSSCPDQDPEGARRHLLECASLLHNVGQYETELGRTTAALKCLTSALDIRRGFSPPDDDGLEIAATLYQLGGLKRRLGDVRGAWDCYAESLGIERRNSLSLSPSSPSRAPEDECNPRVAALLYRMAQIRYETCELERSLELFRAALAVVSMDGFASAAADMEERQDEGEAGLAPSGVLGWIGTVQGEMGLVEEARRSFEASRRASREEAAAAPAQQVAGRSNAPSSSSSSPGLSVETFAEMLEGRPAAAA